MTPLARRQRTRISDEERAEIKREILGEVRDALYHGDTDDRVLEALDKLAPEADAPLTSVDDLKNLTVEEMIARKDEVDRVLAHSGQATLSDTGSALPPTTPTGPARTGQSPISEHQASEFAPLSRAAVESMTPSELAANRTRVDRWLEQTGGRA